MLGGIPAPSITSNRVRLFVQCEGVWDETVCRRLGPKVVRFGNFEFG